MRKVSRGKALQVGNNSRNNRPLWDEDVTRFSAMLVLFEISGRGEEEGAFIKLDDPAFRFAFVPSSLFPRETRGGSWYGKRRHEFSSSPPTPHLAGGREGPGGKWIASPRRCPQLSLLPRFQDEQDGISNYVSKWNNIIRVDGPRKRNACPKFERNCTRERKDQGERRGIRVGRNPHGQLSPSIKYFPGEKTYCRRRGRRPSTPTPSPRP